MRMMPFSSRSLMASSPTLGMSRVISSGPSFVSRASTSYFSMCTDVKRSSWTSRLGEQDGVFEVAALPGQEGHNHVLTQGPAARFRWTTNRQ